MQRPLFERIKINWLRRTMHLSLIHMISSKSLKPGKSVGWVGKRNGRENSAPVKNLRACFSLFFSSLSAHFIFSVYNDSFKVLYIYGRGVDSSYVKLSLADNVLFYYQAPVIPSELCSVCWLLCSTADLWTQGIPW